MSNQAFLSYTRPNCDDVVLSVSDVEFGAYLYAEISPESFLGVEDICFLLAAARMNQDSFMYHLESLASEIDYDYKIKSDSATREQVSSWMQHVCKVRLIEAATHRFPSLGYSEAMTIQFHKWRPWRSNDTNCLMSVMVWNWLNGTMEHPTIPDFLPVKA